VEIIFILLLFLMFFSKARRLLVGYVLSATYEMISNGAVLVIVFKREGIPMYVGDER
jgi:hypothetical protein